MLRKTLDIVLGRQAADYLLGAMPQFGGNQYQKIEREMIAKEAVVGATVLGQAPAGHTRQFFCLDNHTWIWNEQWIDTHGKQRSHQVQYDVRPDVILKRINGGSPLKLGDQELINFDQAVSRYYHEVATKVYGRSVVTA